MSVEVADLPKTKKGVQDNYILGLNHVSLHVRNVDEAVKFWMDLFEATPHNQRPGRQLFHVKLSGTVLAFFELKGVIGRDVEFPHYAFTTSCEGMRVLKQRLEEAGVKTHPFWTRNQSEALMYFRDPSGNLFELYCPQYDRPEDTQVGLGKASGSTFRPPIGDLNYEWPKPLT
jgi:catechol 2,3-dioxygenase-like lactoylglutathione lyase family enzyme